MAETGSVSRAGGLCGLGAAILNFAGVLPLAGLPAAYKPHRLPEWLAQLQAHPTETAASAWMFTAGVLLLLPFAAALRRQHQDSGWIFVGGWLIAAGGLMNGSATLAPFVVSHVLLPAGVSGAESAAVALLGLALTMDALFNALLGAGLLLVGVGLWGQGRRALGGFGVVAGAATLPVVMQSVSAEAAGWLGVAGPLWLGWLTAASVGLLRRATASP